MRASNEPSATLIGARKVATRKSRAVSIRDVFSPAGERIAVSLIWNSREVSQPTSNAIGRFFDPSFGKFEKGGRTILLGDWRSLRFVNLLEKYRSISSIFRRKVFQDLSKICAESDR